MEAAVPHGKGTPPSLQDAAISSPPPGLYQVVEEAQSGNQSPADVGKRQLLEKYQPTSKERAVAFSKRNKND